MIDRDVEATIQRIRNRIAKLQKIIEMLLEEFGEPGKEPMLPNKKGGPARRTASKKPPAKRGQQKKRVIRYIKKNGPAFRRVLLSETGVPVGTLSTTLNDKKTFVRLDDGRWGLKGVHDVKQESGDETA